MYESTACSRNTTPVVFSLYSEMCVMGGCGKYGRCYQFFSGGNMFSTCQCFAGYRGWGCTDASQVCNKVDKADLSVAGKTLMLIRHHRVTKYTWCPIARRLGWIDLDL